MFISAKDKNDLFNRIAALEVRAEQLARSLNAVLDAQTMRSDPTKLKLMAKPLANPKPLSVKQKEDLKRLRRNEYQRQYKLRKKQANASAV
jgi:hypothetical protein